MPKKLVKHIVFVRHAHRDTADKSQDNGLSSKGKEQTSELLKQYEDGELPPGDVFMTSPKRRCIETIEPLSQRAGSILIIEPSLDEQKSGESEGIFAKRIEKFLKENQEDPRTHYLCSHGDVIPQAIDELTGNFTNIGKGQALVFKYEDGFWIML